MSNFFDDQVSEVQTPTVLSDELPDGEKDTTQAGDGHYTPLGIKKATQELMKFGLLEMKRKPKLYQTALSNQPDINAILAPLDLMLKIDDIRGLAFLIVANDAFSDTEEGEWSHPLIRRQRLTLEQTLLIAILRQQYVVYEQEAGIGAGGALIDVDDLKPQLFTYLGESGSEARDRTRLVRLLEQLHAYGIVSEINDKAQITIRPIITHLANPESLQLLLQHFCKTAGANRNP